MVLSILAPLPGERSRYACWKPSPVNSRPPDSQVTGHGSDKPPGLPPHPPLQAVRSLAVAGRGSLVATADGGGGVLVWHARQLFPAAHLPPELVGSGDPAVGGARRLAAPLLAWVGAEAPTSNRSASPERSSTGRQHLNGAMERALLVVAAAGSGQLRCFVLDGSAPDGAHLVGSAELPSGSGQVQALHALGGPCPGGAATRGHAVVALCSQAGGQSASHPDLAVCLFEAATGVGSSQLRLAGVARMAPPNGATLEDSLATSGPAAGHLLLAWSDGTVQVVAVARGDPSAPDAQGSGQQGTGPSPLTVDVCAVLSGWKHRPSRPCFAMDRAMARVAGTFNDEGQPSVHVWHSESCGGPSEAERYVDEGRISLPAEPTSMLWLQSASGVPCLAVACGSHGYAMYAQVRLSECGIG